MPGLSTQSPNAFQSPASTNAAGVASNIGNVLSTINSKPFSPATAGSFLPSSSQGVNFGDINTNGVSFPSGNLASPTVTPSTGFSIPTTTAVPSTALQSPISASNIYAARDQYQAALGYTPLPTNTTLAPSNLSAVNPNANFQTEGSADETPSNPYAEYAQQLAQANTLSPEYISALQGVNAANLKAQQDQINGQYIGDTTDFAQGATARQEQTDALNTLGANQALSVQQAVRQGNISAATALTQAAQPTSVSPGSSLVSPLTGGTTYNGLGGLTAVNAVDQYNSLQQSYPGANIPPYDPTQSPAANQQIAQMAVANSPQYQAQYLTTYSTPGGGTGVFNKLNSSLLQPNADGTLSLVSGASAALGSANASALGQQVQQYNTTSVAFNTVNSTLANMIQFMQQNGINQAGVPIINQLQNKFSGQTQGAGIIAAYNADIQELRTNAAQVIARGGSIAGTNDEANQLIPDSLSPDQLAPLAQQFKQNGVTALNQMQTQMSQITSQLPGGTSSQSFGSSQSATSAQTNPFSASSFFGQ